MLQQQQLQSRSSSFGKLEAPEGEARGNPRAQRQNSARAISCTNISHRRE